MAPERADGKSCRADHQDCHLDVLPSRLQGRLLKHIASGLEIAKPHGQLEVRQTGEIIGARTVQSCFARRWIDRLPGLPLFDPPARLTERGRAALRRIQW